MRPTRAFAVLVGVLPMVGGAGQEQAGRPVAAATQIARVIRVPELARFDEAAPNGRDKAVRRWMLLLGAVPIGDAPARSLTISDYDSARGPILLARGSAEQLAAAQTAIDALRLEPTLSARLQCTVVTMPIAVARDHALRPGETKTCDPAACAGLLRDAVKAKGKLYNLPEVVTGALTPFVREAKASAAATAKAPAGGDRTLRLRGEIAPLGNGELAVGLQLVRGALPSDVTQMPAEPLAQPVFRLAAGKVAMMMALDGDTALVLIAQCTEVGAAAPAGAPR